LGAASPQAPALQVDPWHTAILMYTSGTTGRPKGVQMAHQGILYLRLCEHLEPSFDYDADDVMLTVMPLFHAMGVSLSLQALYNGGAVAVRPMPEPGELLGIIDRDKPSVLPLVPTAIQMMLDHPDAAATDLSSLRLIVYAGSPMGPHLLQRAMQSLQCDFTQFYGSTETHAGVTFLRPEQHRGGDETLLKSCGSPLPLIDIRIVDTQGNEVADGEVGEFLIRSPSLTTGYYHQPEATASAFADGWFHSGDVGYRDKQGLLYLVDRLKDMIISGGENVYSTEVEQALQKHPAVQACAVIGLPDDKWGERVVAVVQPHEDDAVDEAALIAHCRQLIAGYKTPKQILFRDSLPVTASGKVYKKALRDELRATGNDVAG
ncbi:MAG: AMP-binding protein, partial [Salinisphaera sp.]|nr:AMP-binding protein [Salinisphaera sp.]